MTPKREAELREAVRVPTREYRPVDEALDAVATLRTERDALKYLIGKREPSDICLSDDGHIFVEPTVAGYNECSACGGGQYL